jgi:formylmethanofuran dehydrogenase subunit E
MLNADAENNDFSKDFQKCIGFHGHLCPGLVYGYLVAVESVRLLEITRAEDEEIVVISENDSCAVDALQVVLGTTTGKGNLIIENYGKNAFTVFERRGKGSYRFSKKQQYVYKGDCREEFKKLDIAVTEGTASEEEKKRQKYLKALDLLSRSFNEIFETKKILMSEPLFAELAKSLKCSVCGELTMSTKMKKTVDGRLLCVPCYQNVRIK